MRNLLNVQCIEIMDDLAHDYSGDEIIQDELHTVKMNWLKIGLVFFVWDIIGILYLLAR